MKSSAPTSSRLRALLVAVVLSLILAALGSFSWSALIIANIVTTPAIPWAVGAMAIVLWIFWQYFGGRGPPRRTSQARKNLLRARLVSRLQFGWSLFAGLTSVAALAGLWILMVRLGSPGGNPTLSNSAGYPAITVALFVVMGSLVSPITEEAAFRGYAQTTLERVFSAPVAIGVSSLLFMFWHGPTQGFVVGKLVFYFLVGLDFGTIAYLNKSTVPALPVHVVGDLVFFTLIWPNDANRALVSTTGIDGAFITTTVGTVFAVGVAVWAFLRLKATAKQP